MTPGLQPRHFDYVLGPAQDSRLATVAAGAVIQGLELRLRPDAPFQMRGRAVYCQFNDANNATQADLQFLKTRFAGPVGDYRSKEFVAESIQSAYFGQVGNPKPIWPPIDYPASGVIRLDIYNAGLTTIANLTFVFRGVEYYPPGTVQGYKYPPRFASEAIQYQLDLPNIAVVDALQNQIFKVRQDADFVLEAGQASDVTPGAGPGWPLNVYFQLMDFNRFPYSSDLVRWDVLFGCVPSGPLDIGANVYAAGGGAFVPAYGAGPGAPGIFYPRIYIPANHTLMYNMSRDDSVLAGAVAKGYAVNFIGRKVFARG